MPAWHHSRSCSRSALAARGRGGRRRVACYRKRPAITARAGRRGVATVTRTHTRSVRSRGNRERAGCRHRTVGKQGKGHLPPVVDRRLRPDERRTRARTSAAGVPASRCACTREWAGAEGRWPLESRRVGQQAWPNKSPALCPFFACSAEKEGTAGGEGMEAAAHMSAVFMCHKCVQPCSRATQRGWKAAATTEPRRGNHTDTRRPWTAR